MRGTKASKMKPIASPRSSAKIGKAENTARAIATSGTIETSVV